MRATILIKTHTPNTTSPHNHRRPRQLSVAEAALKLLADDAELANLWAYCHGAPMILGWWQAAAPSCPGGHAAGSASASASHETTDGSDGAVSSASQDLLDDIGTARGG